MPQYYFSLTFYHWRQCRWQKLIYISLSEKFLSNRNSLVQASFTFTAFISVKQQTKGRSQMLDIHYFNFNLHFNMLFGISYLIGNFNQTEIYETSLTTPQVWEWYASRIPWQLRYKKCKQDEDEEITTRIQEKP